MVADRPLRLFIDVELKDIGPGVMTGYIQVKFSSNDLCQIDFRNQNRLAANVFLSGSHREYKLNDRYDRDEKTCQRL